MTLESDIVIIGAGLAGLSFGWIISSQHDIGVIFVEPGKSKKNNPTRLTFRDTIEKWGLEDSIRKSYNTFHLITPNQNTSSHIFENEPLVSLDYAHACEGLRLQIQSRKNVKFLRTKAVDFQYKKNEIQIFLKDGTSIQSKLMIDASGKAHLSRRKLSLDTPSLYSHSYGLLFEGSRYQNEKACYFIAASRKYGSGGGWFYPLGQGRASMGIAVVNNTPTYPGRELKQNYKKAVREIQPFAEFLQTARPMGYEIGTIPIEHIDETCYDNILIIGDAAGHAIPWMCMGVEPALQDGELAAQIALQALEEEKFYKDFLKKYQLKWNEKNLSNYSLMKYMEPKLWFADDETWDFIVRYDLSNLSPQQLLERMHSNAHLMSNFTSLRRWGWFRLRKLLGI